MNDSIQWFVGSLNEKQQAAYSGTMVLGRYGSARECAEAITFLALPLSSYITGQDLTVDGGMLAKLAIT